MSCLSWNFVLSLSSLWITVTLEALMESGKGYEFNTCGATGPDPPTESMCFWHYSNSQTVKIATEPKFAGAQVWEVPYTSEYSITAMGGSGGMGVKGSHHVPYGTMVHQKFQLTEGEKLYFVIGQEGQSACRPEMENKTNGVCQLQSNDLNSSMLIGGGGGGGGATFVFKVLDGHPELLLAAAGGGGLGAEDSKVHRSPVGHTDGTNGQPDNQDANTAGGGKGWNAALENFAATMRGGRPCGISVLSGFSAHGGYGGGGGGCTAGGGGGGHTGGNAGIPGDPQSSGFAGKSFSIGTNEETGRRGNGFVDVLRIRNCPCEFYCLWKDQQNLSYTCFCPSTKVLAADKVHCIEKPILETEPEVDIGVLIAAATICTVIVIMIGVVCVCICGRTPSRNCHGGRIRLERILAYCKLKKMPNNSQRVRQSIQRPMAVIEFNPNYDFIGAKHPQPLQELNRRHLKLVRALGHGAFGEVYKGMLSHVPRVQGEMSVAVKTLPALSSDQTEFDFQMEAIIVSKFDHPNIVKFLGVCFEARPRFIVLELLEGGDLKSFLRDSRPKPSEPSSLTVMDLLKLARDVACGCQHLEEKHFIHRDIAARNCLLTTKGPERQAKIADFGMARDIYRSDYYKKSGNALLPVKWMPPEAFLDGVFTTKTDIWSFGILLWEIFSLGYMPYPGCCNEEVMHFVTVGGRLEAPDSCPSSVYDIMASCWSGLAEERPPFSLILTSLEKCMEDEDITSKGLRILYLPTLSMARGFKLPSKSPNSLDRSTGLSSSDGCQEPLLPSWITEGLPDPRINNEDDLSDEEARQSRSKPDNKNSGNPPMQHSVVEGRRLPSPEVPLLSVEDFQVLFENSRFHDER